MPHSLATKPITEGVEALAREARQQFAESSSRGSRATRPSRVTIDQQVESSVASAISSKGHAGPGGQPGESLNVVA